MKTKAFTLFEVLIALGVFAMAVTGLALALQSAVDAALNARSRMLARTMIESRLASAMANPPLDGRREIDGRTNNGMHVLETFEQAEIQDTNSAILPGMWRLKVTAEPGRGGIKEMAEILVYRP
jgi:type II secretion system protein I